MDQELFLRRLAVQLEMAPGALTPEAPIGDWWDSVAILSTIALIDDQCGHTVSGDALSRCVTVADILRLAGA